MGGGREFAISLDGVRDKNVMQLKKLNTVLFPVRYNDKYYADALASGDFAKLAYYSDICVESIACRLEKKEGGAICTNNDDAINFYKKFGFEITETIKSYYTNIDPPDCFVLTKFITTSQANK
ncbi:hypothetical protein PVK06_005157 [Gossypium arboreum]|uniref:N-acetyltransferase domain-containing protein n=1 Tax=Gossypium arboreum TaxID=29729 RepID=A0ABR0QUU7_GOSAR|nr:hypothetical protein PVK06_005157 [Gossypium arboreum]